MEKMGQKEKHGSRVRKGPASPDAPEVEIPSPCKGEVVKGI